MLDNVDTAKISLIIAIIILVVLVVLSIILYLGKGNRLVFGRGYTPRCEKATHYMKITLRKLSYLVMGFIPCVFVLLISILLEQAWLLWTGFALSMGWILFAMIYIRKNEEYTHAEYLARMYAENPNYKEEKK